MTEIEARIFTTVFFTVIILFIFYVIYYEYKTAKINEENAKIKLGEEQNEDLVNNLTNQQLVDLANKGEGSVPTTPTALDSIDKKGSAR